MKVYFLITSSDRFAKGGHFRSCLTIAESITKNGGNVEIINIGKTKSPVFENTSLKITFIPLKLFNFPKVIWDISRKINGLNFRLIAFDYTAFFIVRHISLIKRIPSGWVRCGGKNPQYSPFTNTLFCFSKENFDFFQSKIKFKNSTKYLIPNRVSKSNRKAPFELPSVLGNNYPIILRIGRIVANYKMVNQTALNLSSFLNQQNIKHNLVFIGYPDDHNAEHYKDFTAKINKNAAAILLGSAEYTDHASLFLSQASLVIGTGRGAMESFVENVPVAVYVKDIPKPILISNNDIFSQVAEKNFSPRTILKNVGNYEEEYLSFFSDDSYRKKIIEFQKSKSKYFDIDIVAHKYIQAFEDMVFKPTFSIIDYFKNLNLFILKLIFIQRK